MFAPKLNSPLGHKAKKSYRAPGAFSDTDQSNGNESDAVFFDARMYTTEEDESASMVNVTPSDTEVPEEETKKATVTNT